MMTSTNPRREAVLIAIFTILGAILRLWNFNRLGLTHFDEGIYAFKGLWSLTPDGLWSLDRELIAYAPPLYPILVGIGYWILPWGMSDLSAIFVSTACGIATIPVVGWLGRRSFGAGAGAAASAFAALSGPHIAFSRMALTDAPFLLLWLIAIGLGMRFIEKPGAWRAIVFGLAVGLAQNVKYNGWLAGVVIAATVCWNLAIGQGVDRKNSLRALRFGLIAAVAATLVYLPWFWFVQTHGGYADLLRHQQSYTDAGAWLPHWKLQLNQSIALSGGPAFTAGAWILAWLGCAIAARGGLWLRGLRSIGRSQLFLIFFLMLSITVDNIPWWLVLSAIPWLAFDGRPSVRSAMFWWSITSLITPIYYPYARLWLPVHAATWLVLGGLMSRLDTSVVDHERIPHLAFSLRHATRGRRLAATAWVLVTFAAAFSPRFSSAPWKPLPGLLEPTDSLRIMLHDQIGDLAKKRFYHSLITLSRPCVLFYLSKTWDEELVVAADARSLKDLAKRAGRHDLLLVDCSILDDPDLAGSLRERGGVTLVPIQRTAWIAHELPRGPSDWSTSLPELLDWSTSAGTLDTSGSPVEPDMNSFATRAKLYLLRPAR